MREWRKLGKSDQKFKIGQAEEQQRKETKKTSRRRRASGRSSVEEGHSDDAPAKDDGQQLYASPPNKVSTAKKRRVDREEGGGGDDNEVDRLVPGGEGVSSPPLLHRPTDPLEVEHEETITYQPVDSNKCRGISMFTIEGTNIKDKDKVNKGFSHLVGNVFRYKASHLSNNQCVWPYGHDVAGFIVNPNAKQNDKDDAEDDPPLHGSALKSMMEK